jgi:branched-chain amino acid transport system substrate-binding protein
MRRERIRRLFVALIFILMGCTLPPMDTPAMATEVAFLDLSDFTGPVAGLALPISSGLEDYIKEINGKGGVEGVKIKYIGVDTRYDVARTISAFKRYARDTQVVAMGIVSTPAGKMLQRLTTDQPITCTVPGDGEFQAHLGNFFTWGPTYQDAFAATIDWVLADWKKKGKDGAPSIAVLSWDNAYGREMLRGGQEYAEKKGVKVLKSELFPTGSLKHDIYLTRIADAGANYVYVGGVDPTQTNIMRDATRLGLTKDIKFISDYWGPTALGTSLHPEALEGMVVVSFFLRGEDSQNNEMMKKFWTKYRQRPIKEMNGGYAIGLGVGMALEAAIKDAIKRVGPGKLTRDEIYKSFQNITGLDRQGVVGPVAYSPTVRRGSNVVKFYEVKGGKIFPVTDWVEAPNAVALHEWK